MHDVAWLKCTYPYIKRVVSLWSVKCKSKFERILHTYDGVIFTSRENVNVVIANEALDRGPKGVRGVWLFAQLLFSENFYFHHLQRDDGPENNKKKKKTQKSSSTISKVEVDNVTSFRCISRLLSS